MIKIEKFHQAGSRASLVPSCDPARIPVAQARRCIKWIPRGTPLTIGNIKTQGGFYLQEGDDVPFSFAINARLALGREDARFHPLHSLTPGNYSEVDPKQRALLLRVLAGGRAATRVSGDWCARRLGEMLEWRLFCDRHDPREVALDAADFADRINPCSRAPLLKIMAWSAFFMGRDFHLAVIEEILLEQCALFVDSSPLHLALFDCAAADRAVGPELALAAECVFGLGFERWGNKDFEQAFLSDFRREYPKGVAVELEAESVLAEYRPHCPELAKARFRFAIPHILHRGPLQAALRPLAQRQFPCRIFVPGEAPEHRLEAPERAVPPEPRQDRLNDGGDDLLEFFDNEAVKDFVLEHAPLVVPLRFLLGSTNSSRQRIEVIAAEFMFLDHSWLLDFDLREITVLQKCFGLTIERHRGGYSYRAKKWNWFFEPTSERAIDRLEELWQQEHEVRLDIEQHARPIVRFIGRDKLSSRCQPVPQRRWLARCVIYGHDAIRLKSVFAP